MWLASRAPKVVPKKPLELTQAVGPRRATSNKGAPQPVRSSTKHGAKFSVVGVSVGRADYGCFRRAVGPQRYREVESQLGDTITISDAVEDAFLHAFDSFPGDRTPGDWFDS